MNSIPNYPTISHTPNGNTPGSRADKMRHFRILDALKKAGFSIKHVAPYQLYIVRSTSALTQS